MQEYAPPSGRKRDTPAPTGREQPDRIVHREQGRAALTDNHRDGLHGSRVFHRDRSTQTITV
jgi:hypothetical protein